MPPQARIRASAPCSSTSFRPASTIAGVVSGWWLPCSETGMLSGRMPTHDERTPWGSSASSSAGMPRGSVVTIPNRLATSVAAA